ncbi:50S ribosomal protein L24 [Candidatus Parcubacteria bacterium]|nr:50S ribosomal protein L24 [Candidatus Parcubacteria bacterium]
MSAHLKTGDTVVVLSGKERRKRGKVIRAYPRAGRITVEGVNVRLRHRRPRRAGEKGQKIELTLSIPAARAMLICPSCGKPTRVRAATEGDQKRRGCRKCGATF